MKNYKRKNVFYLGFIDLEKVYDRINREDLWQVLRMHDFGSKLLSRIKSMYVNCLACVRVKGGESDWLRIVNGVGQGCIISTWLFNIYMKAVMDMKMGMGRRGESGDYLVSCMQMT